jgi:hypothetical protein
MVRVIDSQLEGSGFGSPRCRTHARFIICENNVACFGSMLNNME